MNSTSVEGIFNRAGLRSSEIARINALKPRERRRVAQILLGVTKGVLGEPLRVRVLRSDLPEDVKAQLFRQNGGDDDKLKNKTEMLLRLPLREELLPLFHQGRRHKAGEAFANSLLLFSLRNQH